MTEEYGHYNPVVSRDVFGHSFQVLKPHQLITRADALDEDEDVTITMEDVTRALDAGRERGGQSV